MMTPLAVQFISQDNAPYIILGLGAFVILYVVVRPMLRRKKDPFNKPFRARSLAQQRSVERQMESLLVELSEMTRQMTAQLDTRAAKLEALIHEADEKIARMQALRQEQGAADDGTVAALRKTLDAARTADESPRRAAIEPPPAAPARDVVDPAHEQVYVLADEGKSVSEIATTLRRPSGEIELILALRPRVER
jgi:hypothetical protein